jgi:uncharacterized protein DUF6335
MRRHQHRKVKHAARPTGELADRGHLVAALDEAVAHTETSPTLTGGDVDADWRNAAATGEEAVGGSVATPDQDIVDELGRALGVERDDEDELTTSEEILRARDGRRWELEAEETADENAGGEP